MALKTNTLLLSLTAILMTGLTMALSTINSQQSYTSNSNIRPVGVSSHWATIVTAGGPATADAATITNPDTEITRAVTLDFIPGDYNNDYVGFRLGYDVTLTAITPMVATVWGQTVTATSTSPWMKLRNLNGDLTMTFTPNTALDERSTSLAYTGVDPLLHVVNRMGCNRIRIGVQTALAGSTGVTTSSIVQAKEFE